jgi:hypothetical protein
MKIKDVNGIIPVSIREQQSIQRWYRISTNLFIALILCILLCHSIQWYMWYTYTYTLCMPLCLFDECTMKSQCTQQNAQLVLLQEQDAYKKECMHKLELWLYRLQHINTTVPTIETLTMSANEIHCTLHCANIASCVRILNALRTDTSIQSVVCTSIKVEQTSKSLECTVHCQYVQ